MTAAPRFGIYRIISAAALTIGATIGSFALLGSGSATAAGTGPDTVAGSAFGGSLTGLLKLLAPTPMVTLPPDGAAQTATLVSIPAAPVITSGTLSAATVANDATLATEKVNSAAKVEGASLLGLPGAGVSATAVASTCQSDATGSTGTDVIVGLSIAGTPVLVPTTPNTFLTPTALGPLAGVLSIEVNVQTVSNLPGATSIINDAIVIKLLSVASGGETVTLADSRCAAAGPDIDVAPSVSSIVPNTGPTAGGTTVTITGSGFACVSGVKFGGTPAASFTVVSPTQITAVSPPGTAGTVDVTVTNCFGSNPTGTSDQFTYADATVPSAPPAPLVGPIAVTG